MTSTSDDMAKFRSIAIGILAATAVLFVLRSAAPVFIPLCFGVILSYTLTPTVNWLRRRGIPRALGAAVLLIAIVGAAGYATYSLSDDADALLESLPEAAQRLRMAMRHPSKSPSGAIENVQKAASEIERAAEESAASAVPDRRDVTHVVVEPQRFNVKTYLWTGTLGLLELIGQMTMALLIAYFLLISGDVFRRKIVHLAGPELSKKRITLEMLQEIDEQIQRYILVQLLLSIIVGIATWLAFLWLGLEHAAVWGVVAAATNLVPYVGAIIIGTGAGIFALLQFDGVRMALLVGLASSAIHAVVANVLAPWLTSRTSRLNTVAVFVGLLAWGWLWGVWGLLLGIPIMMAIKAVCDRVPELQPIGEFLG
jgi:predicted PurR-regulated permease PerM